MRFLPLALALFALPSTARAQTEGASTPKVAVVDVRKLFDSADRMTAMTSQMNKEKADMQVELQKIESDIKQNMTMLEGLDPRGKLARGIREKVIQMQALLEFKVKAWNEEIAVRVKIAERELYNEALSVIATYAKERGIGLIYKIESGPIPDDETEKVDRRIDARGVLYMDPALDITGDILLLLNARYAAEKK